MPAKPIRARRFADPPAPARVVVPSGASAEADGERIVVRDRKGAVVVVFDAATGAAEVHVAEGDLRLVAKGKIVLDAGDSIELTSATRAQVRAPELSLAAGRLELTAERVFERASEIYREVDGLLQTRAGRVRSIVKDVYQLLAKRTRLVAEEDASMDGKRVLLG